MDFDYPEDRAFFASLLCGGDEAELVSKYGHCFDFRDPLIKRAEFNRLKDAIKTHLIERYGQQCMLAYPAICTSGDVLVLDHFIPLSSNELNKTLRHLPSSKGKKVQTQSFGSNHPDNFVLACPRCNAYKKNRLPDASLIRKVLQMKAAHTVRRKQAKDDRVA